MPKVHWTCFMPLSLDYNDWKGAISSHNVLALPCNQISVDDIVTGNTRWKTLAGCI